MSIKEFIFGVPGGKEAKDTVYELEKNKRLGSLRRGDDARLTQAKVVLKRHTKVVHQRTLALLAAIGVGYGASKLPKADKAASLSSVAVEHSLSPLKPIVLPKIHELPFDREDMTLQEMDQLIASIDQGFNNFSTLLKPSINAWNFESGDPQTEEQLRMALLAPFVLSQKNHEHYPPSHRNAHYREGTDIIDRLDSQNIQYSFKGLNLLFSGRSVQFNANPKEVAAAYAHALSTMNLSPTFDPNNVLDLLVLYHEWVHAEQDYNIRRNMSSLPENQRSGAIINYLTARVDFNGSGQAPCFVNDEGAAYSRELLILNILTEGQLAKRAESGNPIRVDELGKILGVRSDQGPILEWIHELSIAFFSSDTNGSSRLVESIVEECKQMSRAPMQMLPDGQVQSY